MTSEQDRGAWPPRRSLPAGWQEVLNPELTRRGLLGGMAATPVALLAGKAFGQATTIVWHDLEFVIAEDQSAVSVLEVEVTRSEERRQSNQAGKPYEIIVTESRCILRKWRVPAAAFGENAYFDMKQPYAEAIDYRETGFERVLHVRGVVYGMRFTRDDREASKVVTGPDKKRRRPGFVSFIFKRPPGKAQRWTIAYETDLWLRASGNTDAVESSRTVAFETFVDETAAVPDIVQAGGALTPLRDRRRPSEAITGRRVGATLDLTFGTLIAAADPDRTQFDVSLDRNLVWHVEALGAAALLVHDGRVRATKFAIAWRRQKPAEPKPEPDVRPTTRGASAADLQTVFFSGEAAGASLSIAGPGGAYRFGPPDGHNIVVKPGNGTMLSLDVVVGKAPFWPEELQAIGALRVESAALSIRMGEAGIANGIAAGKLSIAQTTTAGARGVAVVKRGVIWGEALGSVAPFPVPKKPVTVRPSSGETSTGVAKGGDAKETGAATTGDETEPDPDGRGHIETPIGPLVVAKPIRRLAMPPEPEKEPQKSKVETGVSRGKGRANDTKVCGPLTAETVDDDPRDKDALIRFFRIANGDRSGNPEASVYALADQAEGASAAVIRRAHIDLTLRGAATALPDTSFSELAFQPTEMRLAYEDGAEIKELPGGEYPLPLASSYVWIGPPKPPAVANAAKPAELPKPLLTPQAVLDLSRATLTCARDYDLMKLRLRFHDLVLHYGPEPTVRPVREEARLRVREDGDLQDSRPLLVAEFDPQHVLEEAVFLPETPALPDVELPAPDTREEIVKHLDGLKTVAERVIHRERIQKDKIAKEVKPGNGQKGPFQIVAEEFRKQAAKIDIPSNLKPLPEDQQIYIGPFALDADAMGIARRLMRRMGKAAVEANLNETLKRVEALAAPDSKLREKQLVDLSDTQNAPGAPTPEPDAVFAIALRNEAVLESLEPFYGVFRTFWRDAFANPSPAIKIKKDTLNDPYSGMLAEYLNKNNRPITYPAKDGETKFAGLYVAVVDAFIDWALGRVTPEGLMGARLSGPSRLAFRINAETPISVDAYEAGAEPKSGDGVSWTGAGNTRFRPIRFTFEGLTEWSRFEPAVTKRAQKLFQTLASGVLPRPGNRPENPSDQAMMRFQGFTEGFVTGEARMAEVRASLKSERIANLETGDNKPWPGEPLDFETAIELPARLILSTAQDAFWRTNRRMPERLFSTADREKSCPVVESPDAVPALESGSAPITGEIVNETPFDLWSVRLETRGQKPGVRAVASPDLRTTALAVRRLGFGPEGTRPRRLPGEGPPPRGPYAPWFIGLDQLESQTLETTLSNGSMATRLSKWLGERMRFRKELPKENYTFFRTSLDAFDRHQLVLLTSTYGLPVIGKRLPGATDEEAGGLVADSGQIEPGDRFALLDARNDQALHKPVPFDVKALSLTALGGSLLHETAFKPSAGADDIYGNKIFEGFSIDTLQQDIVLGRDIRTEVVYKGYLLPLGHKASFVKLTERIFLKVPGHGIKAILRQRMFLRMADPEKLYGAIGQANAGRQWCAKRVIITTDKTPDILDPTFPLSGKLDANPVDLNGRIWLGEGPGLAFWPRTDVTDKGVFRFPVTIDGAPAELPMIFIDNIAATSAESVQAACSHYNAQPIEATLDEPRPLGRTVRLAGRKLDYAPNSESGEGQFETDRLVIRAQGRMKEVDPVKWVGAVEERPNFETDGVLEGASQPPFYPTMQLATIRLGRVERMSGGKMAPVDVQYDGHYVLYGFPEEEPPRGLPKPSGKGANPQEIFLVLRGVPKLDMGDSGDRSGGIARPNSHIVAISRSKGPMGGDEGTWWSTGPKDLAGPPPKDYNESAPYPDRLEAAFKFEGLVSLAPYFNTEVKRPEPAKIPAEAKYEDDRDPYDAVPAAPATTDDTLGKAAAAIEQIKSFFSMDAKLLGTVRLKHVMKLLGLSLDNVPVLKEVQEFGTAALRDVDALSNDVRTRVLAPLRDIVARLRREWRLFDKKVSEASSAIQEGLDKLVPTTPLSLAKVYPEVETGLNKVEEALVAALATEDAASLLARLSAVHSAAKLLLRGLALIAANPVERLDDAITGNLKKTIEDLTKAVDEMANLATGWAEFLEEVANDVPVTAAEFVTERIFAWLGANNTGLPAPPKLADLMPLASLPPALPDLAKTLIVDVGAEIEAFLKAVDKIAAGLATKIDAASKTALRAMLVEALTALFSGEEAAPAIQKGVEKYCDSIRADIDTSVGEAKASLVKFSEGTNVAVVKAALALIDALESYRNELADALFDAAFELALRYPDELQAVATRLQQIEAATRNGKALAAALKDGNPIAALKASAGFARDVLGVDVAAVKGELDALRGALEQGFVARANAVLRSDVFQSVSNANDVPVLAREMEALRLLPNRPDDQPWPLPILGDPPNVVGSNALLAAVGKTLNQLIAVVDRQKRPLTLNQTVMPADLDLEVFRKQVIEIAVKYPQAIEKAAQAVGKPALDSVRLIKFIKAAQTLIQGENSNLKNCLIGDLEGLYGDVVDIAMAARAFQAVLAKLFPDTPPPDKPEFKGKELEEALGETLHRLRQLGTVMANRLTAMITRLADFATEYKDVLAAGALIGGAATVLDDYLKKGHLDEIDKEFKQAITEAKAALDKVENEIVGNVAVVANFALSLIESTAVGGAEVVEALKLAPPKIKNVAAGFGIDIAQEIGALNEALVGLGTHLQRYSGLALPAKFEPPVDKNVFLKDLLDAELKEEKLTLRTLFNLASGPASFATVEAALRGFESSFLREVKKLRARLEGAPDEIRRAAEKALLRTGVFGLLDSTYAKIVTKRDELFEDVVQIEAFRPTAEKTLMVEREPALDAEGATIEGIDRLDQERTVAADLAGVTTGELTDELRRRLVVLLNGWGNGKAAPLAIKNQAEDFAKQLMRGDVLDAIDFSGFRDQIEDAIAGLIPTKLHLSYDFSSFVKEDAGQQAIFRPLIGSDFGIALRATIDLLKGTSEFGATASIGPFEIFLIGGIVDALRLKFGGAAFTVATNTSARFDVLYEDFVIGKDLEFAQKLQSFLSPKGGGAFIQPMTRGAGIEVGYGLDLGTIGVGATSFFNVSLNVSAELPFGDQESLFKVSLGRRLSPFTMGVFPFVGSGYFAIYAAANGIRGFEASFEYGGGAAIGYGPFQASVRIQAGVFVRIIKDEKTGKKTTEIYGTFFAGGSASIWIFHFATSLYVRLGVAEGGAMYGEAIYSFSFSLGIADYDYSITAYKKEKSLGNKPSATGSLDRGGPTRFAALPPGVDPMTTASNGGKHIVVTAANQADSWQTYATYFDNDLIAELF